MLLVKKYIYNGNITCENCDYYEKADSSVGISNCGCTHPILYDDFGEIIESINNEIIQCLEDPKHCVLFQEKKY